MDQGLLVSEQTLAFNGFNVSAQGQHLNLAHFGVAYLHG